MTPSLPGGGTFPGPELPVPAGPFLNRPPTEKDLPMASTKSLSGPAASPVGEPAAAPGQVLPSATEVCLQGIKTMEQRIRGYVEFICQVGTLNGTSAEAKEKAVAAFHERMAVLERQLGRIQEDLRLG